jgi:ribokinase
MENSTPGVLDFLAIGDITTDAFIRLKDARVHCDVDNKNCTLSVRFGDKIPYEFAEVVSAVGNSANAAVSAARLGLQSALVANLGLDSIGDTSIETLKKNGVSTEFITRHKDIASNYHYVLWYEDERTILVKHEHYPYKFNPPKNPPKWLYLSSLGNNSAEFHNEIATYIERNPRVKLAFQPGTFQMKLGSTTLEKIYEHTEIFFCNVEEAQRILNTEEKGVGKLLHMLRKLGPKTVVITDGPKGAYAFDGNDGWFMPPFPDVKPPYERTGAGDAFASTVTVALALGKPLPEALRWGPINSMSVVQYVGAQKGLLTRDALETYLKSASPEYSPKKIV